MKEKQNTHSHARTQMREEKVGDWHTSWKTVANFLNKNTKIQDKEEKHNNKKHIKEPRQGGDRESKGEREREPLSIRVNLNVSYKGIRPKHIINVYKFTVR